VVDGIGHPHREPRLHFRVAAEEQHGEAALRDRWPHDAFGDALRHDCHETLDALRVVDGDRRAARARRLLRERADAFAGRGDRAHHVDGKCLREASGVDGQAARVRLVAHVQREHHRHAGLGERERDREAAAQMLRIGHLDQRGQVLVQQRAHRRALVVGARREGERAGGVEDRRALVEARRRARDLDGGARVVRDRDVRAGQPVEHHRLADVRCADERIRATGTGGRVDAARDAAALHGD
jgi:hypothetical protein